MHLKWKVNVIYTHKCFTKIDDYYRFIKILFIFIEELKEHFVQYGEITNISLKTDPATGRSRGFAFIIFKSVDGLNNVSYS